MRVVLNPANAAFNAAAGTITFSTTVPASLSHVLFVANLTRGVVYFDPTNESGGGYLGTATYASPVLSLPGINTVEHANGDRLFIEWDDGTSGGGGGGGGGGGDASAANQTLQLAQLQEINADLGAPSAAAATSDDGTFGLLPLVKRLLGKLPALVSGRIPVDHSAVIQLGGGAVTASTQRVTLASDGPGVAALTSIDSKTPALASGASPVLTTASPTDPTGTGTRQYDWANSLRQAFTSTSTAAVALPTLGTSREVMFHASPAGRCFVRFGDSSVTAATVAAGQMVVEAGERFHIRIPAGTTHFRVIRDTADGFLNVTAVL